MARQKLGKDQKTIGLTPELVAEIKAEAERFGVPWTSMVSVLLRQALDGRKAVVAR
jgi:hypothetical protein